MTFQSAETIEFHTRLMKCALEVEHSRAYWQRIDPDHEAPSAEEAFDQYWFGARSLARAKMLLTEFRERYDAFPSALRVLHLWEHMEPTTRRVICHWHLQLADPLYRAFTGAYLAQRREQSRPELTRDLVVQWIAGFVPQRWTLATRVQFARKLLSAATSAGLLRGTRDPRSLQLPRVDDEALTYMLYLLREVTFHGTFLANPYFNSLGLVGEELERRLRPLAALRYRRQGDLVDFGWQHQTLADWAEATILAGDPIHVGEAS